MQEFFMKHRSVIRKAETRKHKLPRVVRGKHALMRTRHLQLSKLKPGDMVLVNTYGSAVSWGVRKALDSPFSHVAVYMGLIGGRHMIKDFSKGRGSKLRQLNDIRKRGNDIHVVRWNGATPKQMNAYMENIKRINGKYDTIQAVSYGIKYRWKKMRGKEITVKDMPIDIAKNFTCSEFIAEAAHPPAEKVKSGQLVNVNPPLIFDKDTHREMVTPKTIVEASAKGASSSVVSVTKESYEEYSTVGTTDLRRAIERKE